MESGDCVSDLLAGWTISTIASPTWYIAAAAETREKSNQIDFQTTSYTKHFREKIKKKLIDAYGVHATFNSPCCVLREES